MARTRRRQQDYRAQVRVVGSGFTTFNYRGRAIAYLDGFQDTGQSAGGGGGGGGGGWEAITPLGARHPREIVTSRYLEAGQLTVTIRELWDEKVWQQLVGLTKANNILQVFEALADERDAVTCQMIIQSPGKNRKWRGKTYHNCVVVGIDDSENVTIGALSVPRNLTIAYTHTRVLNNQKARQSVRRARRFEDRTA